MKGFAIALKIPNLYVVPQNKTLLSCIVASNKNITL